MDIKLAFSNFAHYAPVGSALHFYISNGCLRECWLFYGDCVREKNTGNCMVALKNAPYKTTIFLTPDDVEEWFKQNREGS